MRRMLIVAAACYALIVAPVAPARTDARSSDPYTQGAADAIARGYHGYVHVPGEARSENSYVVRPLIEARSERSFIG
jgi:hypothetical protein